MKPFKLNRKTPPTLLTMSSLMKDLINSNALESSGSAIDAVDAADVDGGAAPFDVTCFFRAAKSSANSSRKKSGSSDGSILIEKN